MEFEPILTPRENSPLPKMSPEEDRTRDAVDSEPKHYQLSYSGPSANTSLLARTSARREVRKARPDQSVGGTSPVGVFHQGQSGF